jgi:hypothetical protein
MADTTIADALLLISKVSSSTEKRLSLLEKVVGENTAAIKAKISPARAVQKVVGENTAAIKPISAPRQVVEKAKPVIVTDFGRKAENDLKILRSDESKDTEDKEPGKGGMGFIKKLIGPALLVLGGLAALITGIMSDGPLKGLLNILSKGGIIGGVKLFQKMAGKQLAKFTSLFAKIMPKNLFANVIKKAKGFLGGITKFLLKPFAKIAGKGGAKGLFGTIGKLFSKFLKPVLKRIPGIGSLISWGFAVSRFKSGDLVGGLIDVASGIATLFPGIGTGISIGLDVLNAFLDVKKGPEEVKPAGSGFKMSDFFGKIKEKIMNNFPIKNLVSMWGGAKKVLTGDIKGGLTDMAMVIPFMAPLADFFFGEKDEDTGERKGGMQGKSFSEILKVIGSTLKEKVGKTLLKAIPSAFGLKNRAAKLLGISIDDTGGMEDLSEVEVTELARTQPQTATRELPGSKPSSFASEDKTVNNIYSDDNMKQQLKIAQAHSKLIVNQTNMSGELLNTQIELLKENISLLREIADKTGVGANIVTNNTTSVTNMNNQRNLRDLQEVYSY